MIRVGGATEVEVKERKDRVDDAMHATRAAVEEGVVPGGGVALLLPTGDRGHEARPTRTSALASRSSARRSQAPARQIAENAGAEGSIVVGQLLESDDPDWGFDAQTGEYVDLVAAGIIDPVKVVRSALQDGASVGGLLITTEVLIAGKSQGIAVRTSDYEESIRGSLSPARSARIVPAGPGFLKHHNSDGEAS